MAIIAASKIVCATLSTIMGQLVSNKQFLTEFVTVRRVLLINKNVNSENVGPHGLFGAILKNYIIYLNL